MIKPLYKNPLLLIISLSILIIGFLIPSNYLTGFIISILALISSFILYTKAPSILNLSPDNPKIKTYRTLLLITLSTFIPVFLAVGLSTNGEIIINNDNKYLITSILSFYIIIFGNLSPKIPFNRYLGLRLPWTVTDESTWKIAHRVLGYTSFPIALLMMISIFFIDGNLSISIGIMSWVIIPSLYSLFYYLKKFKTISF
ncbi:MAG: SdpI family protein [Clostridium sp.]